MKRIITKMYLCLLALILIMMVCLMQASVHKHKTV